MSVRVNRRLRLSESEYFADPGPKSGIALHHTMGDDARATVRGWRSDRTARGKRRRVATAYVIDRDGTIYELFDPAAWAFHLSIRRNDAPRVTMEKRFVGITIASDGPLDEDDDGRLEPFGAFDRARRTPKSEALECPTPYRGFKWFARYKPAQLESLGRLVDELCDRFSIARVYPARPFLYYGDRLRSFEGVIGHANVRLDRSDPAPDPELWKTLERMAGLAPTAVAAPSLRDAGLTDREREALSESGAQRVQLYDTPLGRLVRDVLGDLEVGDA